MQEIITIMVITELFDAIDETFFSIRNEDDGFKSVKFGGAGFEKGCEVIAKIEGIATMSIRNNASEFEQGLYLRVANEKEYETVKVSGMWEKEKTITIWGTMENGNEATITIRGC